MYMRVDVQLPDAAGVKSSPSPSSGAEEPGFWPEAFNHHAMYRVASPIIAAASV
jgi:hypothetical protein